MLSLSVTCYRYVNDNSHTTSLYVQKAEANASYQTFGMQKKWRREFEIQLPRFHKAVTAGLIREPALSKVVQNIVRNVTMILPQLVSFGRAPWQRYSNQKITTSAVRNDGELLTAEVDLFPLIRDAVAHCGSPAVMGQQFIKDYPAVLGDLWTFDDSFLLLASGVPSWAPLPSIRRAVKARDRIIRNIQDWSNEYKKSLRGISIPMKDYSDVSDLMRQMIEM